MVTDRCNSRCNYCFSWREKNSPDLPLAHILKFIDSLARIGGKQVVLSGGEPLLRDDIECIVEKCRAKNITITVNSNGLLATPARLASLFNAGLNGITFSLDTLDADLYQQIRGVPLKHVLAHILAAKEIQKQFNNTWISVTAVINRLNIHHIADMVRFFHPLDIGVNFQILQPPFFSYLRDANDAVTKQLYFSEADRSLLEEKIDLLIQMKEEGYNISVENSYLKNGINFSINRSVPDWVVCRIGAIHVGLYCNSKISSCLDFGAIGDQSTDRLEDIWFSSKWRKFRKAIKASNCRKCWIACNVEGFRFTKS